MITKEQRASAPLPPIICGACGELVRPEDDGYVVFPPPTLELPPVTAYHSRCGRSSDERVALRRYLVARARAARGLPPPRPRSARITPRHTRAFQILWHRQRRGLWREVAGPQIYVVRGRDAILYVGQTIKTVGIRIRQHIDAGDAVGQAVIAEHLRLWERLRERAAERWSSAAARLPVQPEISYYDAYDRWVRQESDDLWVEACALRSAHHELDLVEHALIAHHQPILNLAHRLTENPFRRWQAQAPLDTAVRVAVLSPLARQLIAKGWPSAERGC